MATRVMTVTFRRRGRCCSWSAIRPPRSIVPGPTMAAGSDLPHDLYTFVIEDALGLEHGFWGCIAAGATFRTLDRKQTPQGKAVIARHLQELDDAEAKVSLVGQVAARCLTRRLATFSSQRGLSAAPIP